MPAISVAIVDPNDIYRFGCKALFESDTRFTLVMSIATLDALETQEGTDGLQVVVLDPVVRGEITRESVRKASTCFPGAAILVITDSLTWETAVLLIQDGARSVMIKSRTSGEHILGAAMLLARKRLAILDEALLFSPAQPLPNTSSVPQGTLSEREQEVLRLLAHGLSDGEIARRLSVATTTIYTHVGTLCRKLRVLNRVQLGVVAAQSGLLNLEDDWNILQQRAS